jgi:two-component system sensor histidine kinase/response regulator
MQEVLVIDDTEEVRSVIIKTLAHFGFEARGAKDGETGVQMALEAPPDLIVCDVRMPVLDGYQTLAKVRELPEIANTPFIFLTAAMEKEDIRRGMVSGADDYLTKPFTPEELLEAVTMRLARQAELRSEIYLRAEKLRNNVTHLLSQELAGPLENIMALTATMMKEYARLAPEKIFVNAREINDYVQRLNRLAKSLG